MQTKQQAGQNLAPDYTPCRNQNPPHKPSETPATLLSASDDGSANDEISTQQCDIHATASREAEHFTRFSNKVRTNRSFVHSNLCALLLPPRVGQDSDTDSTGGLGKAKADNLWTSFAFLVEAFAKTASRFQRHDGTPNVSVIAEHLAAIATKANFSESLPGQSAEAIKDRIEEAARIKRQKLPLKGAI